MADFKQHWQKRTQEKEFKDNLDQLLQDSIEQFLDLKTEDFIDFVEYEIRELDHGILGPLAENIFEGLTLDSTKDLLEYIEKQNHSIAENMQEDTLEKWRSVATYPVEVPHDTVHKIMNQKAVRELFTDIIHKSIVGFNKKFNPLAGATAIFGIDNQIREFIEPFMDTIVEVATEFVTSKDNQQLSQDFAGKVFDIIVHEKPDSLQGITTDEMHDTVAAAVKATLLDETSDKRTKDAAVEVLGSAKKRFAGTTLREMLKKQNISLPERRLTDREKDEFAEFAAGHAWATFLEKEFNAFNG